MYETKPCRACDAPMVWAHNPKTGKNIPFDPEPAENGTHALEESGDPDHPVHAIYRTHAPKDAEFYMAHFVTCPEADRFRAAKRR